MTADIKGFVRGLSLKQIVFTLIFFLSLISYLLLTLWINGKVGDLADQQAVGRPGRQRPGELFSGGRRGDGRV